MAETELYKRGSKELRKRVKELREKGYIIELSKMWDGHPQNPKSKPTGETCIIIRFPTDGHHVRYCRKKNKVLRCQDCKVVICSVDGAKLGSLND